MREHELNKDKLFCPYIGANCVGDKCIAFQDWWCNRYGYCRALKIHIEGFGMRKHEESDKSLTEVNLIE